MLEPSDEPPRREDAGRVKGGPEAPHELHARPGITPHIDLGLEGSAATLDHQRSAATLQGRAESAYEHGNGGHLRHRSADDATRQVRQAPDADARGTRFGRERL